MTGAALESLVRDELRRARLKLRFEVRRNPIGCFVLLWSDLAWVEGIGGRRWLARDPDVRGHQASIGVMALHSRVPRVSWYLDDGASEDYWLPTRCPEGVVAALVCHAIAAVAPTAQRARDARCRLRAAGVRLSDVRTKPSYARRPA